MDPDRRCHTLAETIVTILKRGIVLSDNAVQYIDSTFHRPSLEVLVALIDQDDDEIESLLDLIFFPDVSLQESIEEILTGDGCAKDDENRIQALVASKIGEIPVCLPDRGTLALKFPDWAVARFIARLKLIKPLDPRLRQSLSRHIPKDRRNRLQVKFRNARFIETDNRMAFFETYFERLKDDCEECLDFLIALFEETEDTEDIYKTLVERKRSYFQSVVKSLHFEQMRRQQNMETLMVQGVRIPYVNREEIEHKMGIIDRICQSLFGRTEFFQKPDEILEESEYHQI